MSNSKAPADPIDARLVRRLAAILNDTGLTEIEVERGDLKIRVARQVNSTAVAYAAPIAAAPAHHPAPITTAPTPPEPAQIAPENAVKSPMVGTVYLAPQPGAEPFVKVGDMIEEGQTLLIIEAMKTMNPIPAPRSGRLVQLLVVDAQPVEFGEALAVIA
jgi:acetyl-CoA carboxylase biotin carboxyl carrier protein